MVGGCWWFHWVSSSMISLVMIRALLLELVGLQEAQEELAVSSPLLFKNLLTGRGEAAAARVWQERPSAVET